MSAARQIFVAEFMRRGRATSKRKRVARAILEGGQAATFSFRPQSGMFSAPAKIVDGNTRALIDAALVSLEA